MSQDSGKHVVEGLFAETSAGVKLLGSRCASCSIPYFPKTEVCHNPDCDDSKIEDAGFGPAGEIWSCAIQDFPPPLPTKYDEPYVPYAMAVVDLDDGLRVLGRVITDDPADVEVGQRVEMVVGPLFKDEDGEQVVVWKFQRV